MTEKTLAMKFLEGQKIAYEAIEYPDHVRDAEQVAAQMGASPEQVYKTLVVLPPKNGRPGAKPMLVMIPSQKQLDLKKLAKLIGAKKLKMASHKEAEAMTGLQVGGISALVLINKGFAIFLDQSAREQSQIYVSAGQRGIQIKLAVSDLVKVTNARLADVSITT